MVVVWFSTFQKTGRRIQSCCRGGGGGDKERGETAQKFIFVCLSTLNSTVPRASKRLLSSVDASDELAGLRATPGAI